MARYSQPVRNQHSSQSYQRRSARDASDDDADANEYYNSTSLGPNPSATDNDTSAKFMRLIGHVRNFSNIPKAARSFESENVEMYFNKVQLAANPTQLIQSRKKFLVFEDNFQSTVEASIRGRLSFGDLHRVCSRYEKEKGMQQHDNKSEQSMHYFVRKGVDPETSKACAFAIAFYSGSNYGTVNRGASTMARRGNGEVTSVLEDTEADHASIIMYYLMHALSYIDFYWGVVTRAVMMHTRDLNQYEPGTLVTWLQFSSTKRGDAPAENFKRRNVIFHIYSLTGRSIGQFSNFPDEDEILFMPHSSFLVTDIIKDSYQSRVFLRQVELGLCQHSIMWVDDNIFDENWGNKALMEKASTAGAAVNVHFIPKVNTDAALVFLASPFGQRMKNESSFRIVTDMYRKNESPRENAGARLLLEVRKMGFNCHCLVFTGRKAESQQHIDDLLNPQQQRNIQVTQSVRTLEKFVSFQ